MGPKIHWELLAHSTDLPDAVALATASKEEVHALNVDVESCAVVPWVMAEG